MTISGRYVGDTTLAARLVTTDVHVAVHADEVQRHPVPRDADSPRFHKVNGVLVPYFHFSDFVCVVDVHRGSYLTLMLSASKPKLHPLTLHPFRFLVIT